MRMRFAAVVFATLLSSPVAASQPWMASDFEIAARFMRHVQSNNFAAAKKMMTPNATIKNWGDYDGPSKPFGDFATYITKCPIHDIESVVRDDGRNLNINLNCGNDEYASASLMFTGDRISEINFGGPPPLVRTTTPAK